jgi:Transposase IS4
VAENLVMDGGQDQVFEYGEDGDEEDDDEGDGGKDGPFDFENLPAVLTAKSGMKWHTIPRPNVKQMPANILRQGREGGLKETVKGTLKEPRDAYMLFMPVTLLEQFVHCTNTAAAYDRALYGEDEMDNEDTNVDELCAFLGLITIMGAVHDTKESVDELWSEVLGKDCYTATMSRNRFTKLLSLFRTDPLPPFGDKEAEAEYLKWRSADR